MFGLKEKRDDLMHSAVSKFVEKADGRRNLWTIFCLSLLGNALTWLLVLLSPKTVLFLFELLAPISPKINILFFIPLASGFISAYSVFRLIFPDVEDDRNLALGMMASFDYQRRSGRRYAVWVLSMIVGVLNTIVCLFWLRHAR